MCRAEEAARAAELPPRGDRAREMVGEFARRDEATNGGALLPAATHAVSSLLLHLSVVSCTRQFHKRRTDSAEH